MVCPCCFSGYHGSDLRANPFEEEKYDTIMVDEPLANPRSSFELLLIRVFMCLLESLYCNFVIFELSYVY